MPNCPQCEEELDFLDFVVVHATRWTPRYEYRLYICHNEECAGFGGIFHCTDDDSTPKPGDPTGAY